MERLSFNTETISDKMQVSPLTQDLLTCKYLLHCVSSYLDYITFQVGVSMDGDVFSKEEEIVADNSVEYIQKAIDELDVLLLSSQRFHLIETAFKQM